jgi:hypothetical protein
MIFGMALELLKTGEKVTRPSWPPQWKEAYLVLKDGMLFLKVGQGSGRVHAVGLSDLLAEDWEQVDDPLTFKGALARGLRGGGTGEPRVTSPEQEPATLDLGKMDGKFHYININRRDPAVEIPECNLAHLRERPLQTPGCLCGHGETCDVCKPR